MCATCAPPISHQQCVNAIFYSLSCDFANEGETSYRSAYDVMSATTTISVYNASRMEARLTITTQLHIRST
jgi:hypothetical protein